jgi:hypothetical protein
MREPLASDVVTEEARPVGPLPMAKPWDSTPPVHY